MTSSATVPWQEIATPALFARHSSAARWKMAKHLAMIDRELVKVEREGNGRLIVSMPPRHGKSELISKNFPAHFLGTSPDKRVILSSYEADFASSWGRKARGLLEEHGHLFNVRIAPESSAANRWDIAGREGGMMTAGVGGPITGKGAHLLIVEDPIKNYEEAHSETYREKLWDWFTSTAYTRLEPGGSVVIVMTRWHEDDLVGRVRTRLAHEKWTELVLPAIAEDNDAMGRKRGEALWPWRFPLALLEQYRKTLGSYQFSSLYQQRPTPEEGGMFRREYFTRFVDAAPAGLKRIRGWDKAATEGGGDYSTGVLMGYGDDGTIFVEDVKRGQWSTGLRNAMICQAAELDRQRAGKSNYQIWLEREGGSGGKESAEISVKELAGFDVHADLVTGSKEARARAFAAQCEARNVVLVRGAWNTAYLDELCSFPGGAHDDQVDASALAFNKLLLSRKKQAMFW